MQIGLSGRGIGSPSAASSTLGTHLGFVRFNQSNNNNNNNWWIVVSDWGAGTLKNKLLRAGVEVGPHTSIIYIFLVKLLLSV